MVKGIYWAFGKRTGAKFLIETKRDGADVGTVLRRTGLAGRNGGRVGSSVRLRGLRGFVKVPGPVTLAAFRESAAAVARVTPVKAAPTAAVATGSGGSASA